MVLFAWAAPAVVALTGDILGHIQPMNDLAAEQSETMDVTDDPAVLFSSSRPDLQPLTFSFHTTRLIKPIWSLTPPTRPPIVHA